MVKLEKYNPCLEYIEYLKGVISTEITTLKQVAIKYDKAKFITNLSRDNIISFQNAKVTYNEKGLFVVSPDDSFFIGLINKCPSFEFVDIHNLELGGIIKRMYAQIEFGYYCEDEITQDEISICDNIFKSLYTNSTSIKQQQIKLCMDKYNELQVKKYINKKIIDGIIYAAYDLYNSLYK